MHFLGVRIVEPALAQLAGEGDNLAVVALDLLDVVVAHGLHVLLLRQSGDCHLLLTKEFNSCCSVFPTNFPSVNYT